jgi:hypothetical protein
VEILKTDLDTVLKDLERLSKGQDVELHATFNKFGKTANLKLHDAPTEDGGDEEPPKNTGLKFFKVPNIRQVACHLFGADVSTFIEGFYIAVWRWRKLDHSNYLLICFMSALSQ